MRACGQPDTKDTRDRPGHSNPEAEVPAMSARLAPASAGTCDHGATRSAGTRGPGGPEWLPFRNLEGRNGCPADPTDDHLADTCATIARARVARAWTDRSSDDPQLLHHRAYRSRQVHARGPDASAHRSGGRPPDAGAVPGPDGYRARARYHDQEPGGPAALDRHRRPAIRPEPHRYPGPCGLLLRGVQVARRVRGRHPAGGRGAGDRGADAG